MIRYDWDDDMIRDMRDKMSLMQDEMEKLRRLAIDAFEQLDIKQHTIECLQKELNEYRGIRQKTKS